jgi:hypothetical protein
LILRRRGVQRNFHCPHPANNHRSSTVSTTLVFSSSHTNHKSKFTPFKLSFKKRRSRGRTEIQNVKLSNPVFSAAHTSKVCNYKSPGDHFGFPSKVFNLPPKLFSTPASKSSKKKWVRKWTAMEIPGTSLIFKTRVT